MLSSVSNGALSPANCARKIAGPLIVRITGLLLRARTSDDAPLSHDDDSRRLIRRPFVAVRFHRGLGAVKARAAYFSSACASSMPSAAGRSQVVVSVTTCPLSPALSSDVITSTA